MDDAELDTLIENLRRVAEVASLPSGAIAMSRHDYVYAAEALTALRAERDALAKDAARLDWVSAWTAGDTTICPPGEHGGGQNAWLIYRDKREGKGIESAGEWSGDDSLRDAIDCAIWKPGRSK